MLRRLWRYTGWKAIAPLLILFVLKVVGIVGLNWSDFLFVFGFFCWGWLVIGLMACLVEEVHKKMGM